MRAILLDGNWNLAYGPQQPQDATPDPARWSEGRTCIPAKVPGNVELDLIAAGNLTADLQRGERVYETMKLEGNEWWYRRTFRTTSPKQGRAELLFEGLDCLGEIWLNGNLIGKTDNMFIDHRFDVTDHIADGENELVVRISSASLAARARKQLPGEWAMACNGETLAIRKAPYMFGWDIMPRIVSAGLWRSVWLMFVPPVRIAETYWHTCKVDPNERTARLKVDWRVESDTALAGDYTVRIRLMRNGKNTYESAGPYPGPEGTLELSLENVDLWWPMGFGEAALYYATVELADAGGNVVAQKIERIGVRTIELHHTDVTSDDKPGEFVFVVNGKKVYIKGTNWVPTDAFPSRHAENLKRTFDLAVDLNCNMIRCWGGNVYEDNTFYDLCDQHGVMVWQDFAMACALYPQTDEFAEQIRIEAESVVRKFRNRASLALWAGDNECDIAHGWGKAQQRDPNSNRPTRDVLPEVLRRLDPERQYLPSSPYLSPALYDIPEKDRHTHMPEDHLWGPRDDYKGEFYTTSSAHFISEIGYHGCPCPETLKKLFDPEYLWPWKNNEQWMIHAIRPTPDNREFDYRIELIPKQISLLFKDVPETIEDYSLASQISQGEALKFFVERWRMGKWRRTGMLWWNLRDGWANISDAVVDYYYQPKLSYEFLRRVHADVCVMCGEAGESGHPIILSNDTLAPTTGKVTVRDADTQQVLFETDYDTPANVNQVLGHLPAVDAPAFWLIEFTHNDKTYRNHYLAGPRPYRLEDYKRWLAILRA